jgi:PAS domain S-box-containing protein
MEASTVKVLLIDDEPYLLDVSKQFLELDRSITIDTTNSAVLAFDLIASLEYDVVVSDYQMPGKDGIQLLKEMREMGNMTPFILFTGKGREEVAIEALNSGADFYLQKGGDPKTQFKELSNMIKKTVQRRRMELDIIEKEEKFENIFNSTNDAIYILNPEGGILEINQVGCDWLGYTKQEMLQKNVREIDSEQYAKLIPGQMKEVLEKGFALFEIDWVTKSGKLIPIEVSARKINYAGRPAILSVTRDVSERKRTEEILVANELKFRMVADLTHDWEYWIGPDGQFIYCSPSCERITSYSSEELNNDPHFFLKMVHPEDKTLLSKHYKMEMKAGPSELDFRIITRKGEIRWIAHACQAVFDDEGKYVGRRAGNRDITERKRAENELVTQYRIAQIFLTQPDDEMFDDVLKVILDTLQSPFGIFGYLDENGAHVVPSMTRQVWDRCHVPNKSIIFPRRTWQDSSWVRAYREKKPNYSNSVSTNIPEGHVAIARHMTMPILFQGEAIGLFQVANKETDYTETDLQNLEKIARHVAPLLSARLQRELANKRANDNHYRYHQLMEKATDAILIHEISPEGPGRLIEVNESACQMLGYRNDELLRMAISDLDVPEQEDNLPAIMNELNSVKSVFFKTELLANGGRRIPVEISANLIDSKGQKVVLAIIRDITERKRVEDALKQMTRDWEQLFDATNDAIWLLDKNQRVMRSNKIADLLWSLPNGGAIGLHCWEIVHHTMDSFPGCPVQRAQTSMIRETIEQQFGDRWYQVIADPIIDAAGQYTGAVHMVRDITERKRADEALLESEKRYRLLVDGVSEAIVVIQDGMLRLVNPMAVTITGFSEQELMSTPFAAFVHQEDRAKVVENYQRRLKGEDVPIRYTFRLQIKDERTRWVEVSVILIEWEGRPATLNLLMDITERKRTEDALQEANRKLNLLSSITRHDIKNQLMATEGSLTLLKMKQPVIASNDDLLRAEVAVKRISSMINFTKEYEDIGVQTPTWQDIQKLVKKGADDVVLGSIKMSNEVPIGNEVFADPLIAKVFHNLIDNAVRHGGNVTTIHFFLEEHDGVQAIVCEDDGVGVPTEMRENIFTRSSGKSHGYGLFFSREILAITGLTILENGEPGKGARFEITVPAGAWRYR